MRVISDFLSEERSFEKQESVKAIINYEGKILLLRRAAGDGSGGQWDLPGGHIEDGEDVLDALKREVFEETDLSITEPKRLTKTVFKIPEKGIDSVMNIYRCVARHNVVKFKPASWKGADGKCEHTEYKWASKEEDVKNLPMIIQLKSIVMKELLLLQNKT